MSLEQGKNESGHGSSSTTNKKEMSLEQEWDWISKLHDTVRPPIPLYWKKKEMSLEQDEGEDGLLCSSAINNTDL